VADAAGAEVAPGECGVLPGPDCGHDLEGLVQEVVAFVEVDAERGELRLQVPCCRSEYEATTGEEIDALHRLCAQERVSVRSNVDVG
jgi:hypothetical protein